MGGCKPEVKAEEAETLRCSPLPVPPAWLSLPVQHVE